MRGRVDANGLGPSWLMIGNESTENECMGLDRDDRWLVTNWLDGLATSWQLTGWVGDELTIQRWQSDLRKESDEKFLMI